MTRLSAIQADGQPKLRVRMSGALGVGRDLYFWSRWRSNGDQIYPPLLSN